MRDKGSGEYNMRYRIDIEEKGDYQWWETRAIVETIIDNVNGDYVVFYGIDLNINEIQEAKQKAEQSEKLKMAFLANMSHEIRTPLNAIVGFSQLMQYTTDQDEIKQYVEIINNNNQLLLTLIEDILDLSKIESGSVVIKKDNININDIMQEIGRAHV